jgi:hypothetical protein
MALRISLPCHSVADARSFVKIAKKLTNIDRMIVEEDLD